MPESLSALLAIPAVGAAIAFLITVISKALDRRSQSWSRELNAKAALLEDRERVVQQVAHTVAGDPQIVALGLVASPVSPATAGEIPSASETTLISRTRVIIRSIAEIE